MGKKIVVITGSPRKAGNSFAMTEAFIAAASFPDIPLKQKPLILNAGGFPVPLIIVA